MGVTQLKRPAMAVNQIESMCVGCGMVQQLAWDEIVTELLDDDPHKTMVTSCCCSVCGEALVAENEAGPEPRDPCPEESF